MTAVLCVALLFAVWSTPEVRGPVSTGKVAAAIAGWGCVVIGLAAAAIISQRGWP